MACPRRTLEFVSEQKKDRFFDCERRRESVVVTCPDLGIVQPVSCRTASSYNSSLPGVADNFFDMYISETPRKMEDMTSSFKPRRTSRLGI